VAYSDTLLTIAELAVALAGFASLISVIGRRQNDTSRAVDSLRLKMMLEVAFRNAAFALLPLPFLQIAPSEPILWRIFSGLYVVAVVSHSIIGQRRGDTASERSLNSPMLILLLITVLAGSANVFGLGGSNAFSLFLANLILGLLAGGLSFLSVAASIFRVEKS